MGLIDNITKTLRDDLKVEIKAGSKISMAACCFSIYAFQELKEQLKDIEEFRFLFTSPTFTAEKIDKQRREFYIPRIDRERTLYGSPFEVKLRNQLTQKAIAIECAEWIKQKVRFKSNTTNNTLQSFMNVNGDAPHTYTPVNGFTTTDLGCERGNSMMNFVNKIDGEDPRENRYLRLMNKKNRLHPFYIIYVRNDGSVVINHFAPKELLDKFRSLCKGKREPQTALCRQFNKETRDGLKMAHYSKLLGDAIGSVINVKQESDLDSFLEGVHGDLFTKNMTGIDDFELICFLVVK